MTSAPVLDTSNGRITAFGTVIDAGSRADGLPSLFSTNPQTVNVEGRQVECVFATAHGTADRTDVDLTLRFEQDRLASAAIALTPPRYRNLDSDAFYASVDERYRFHERWLRAAGVPGLPATFPWGTAGVARDRSENVYIYLHWAPRLAK